MGEVWEATGPDGTTVAVKVLPERLLEDAGARRRFAREVAAARRVDHPRVQAVLDADPDAERPWLATELVPGPTLAQHVAAHGAVRGPELHALALGLAQALVAIHAAGVVHRDLTPGNVVLGADGPVLVDFGIARFAEATTITLAGSVVGTPAWMAPEQLRDDEVSDASDVWSWAMVLAYAGTGRAPVEGSRPEVVMRRVLDGELAVRGLPPWLDQLVRRCLDPVPARRPTADELVRALDGTGATVLLDPGPTEVLPTQEATVAPPGRARERRSVPWTTIAARAGTLAVGAALGLVLPPLVVVLLSSVGVIAAVGLRLWAQERGEDRPAPVVGPGTVFASSVLCAGAALSVVLGVIGAAVALLLLVVVFLALGGDLS